MASKTNNQNVVFRVTTVEEISFNVGDIPPKFVKDVMEANQGFVEDWSWFDLGDSKTVEYTVEVL
jgi:hypothetical protein